MMVENVFLWTQAQFNCIENCLIELKMNWLKISKTGKSFVVAVVNYLKVLTQKNKFD